MSLSTNIRLQWCCAPFVVWMLVIITGPNAEVDRKLWIQPKPKFTSMSYLPPVIEDLNEKHNEGLMWGNYMHHHSNTSNGCLCHYLYDEESGYMFVECGHVENAFPLGKDMKLFFQNYDIQLTQIDSPKIRRLNLYNVKFHGRGLPLEISAFYPERLRELSVINTTLQDLPPGSLDDFKSVDKLKITHNKIATLTDGVFHRMGYIETVDLSHNDIVHIGSRTFHELKYLNILELSHNDIEIIEKEAFSKLGSLSVIKLSFNAIRYLTLGIFHELKALTSIDLSRNKIVGISKGVFEPLESLTNLDLSYNEISQIEAGVFYGTSYPSLQHVDLRSNQLKSIDTWPLALRSNFLVNLERNLLQNFTNEVNWQYTCDMEPLRGVVQLSFNKITHMKDMLDGWGFNTQDAQIRIICMYRSDQLRIDLRRNPFICDCVDFEIYKYIKMTKISTIVDQLMCDQPAHLHREKIITIPIDQFQCFHDEECPEGCTCHERPAGKPFFISCSNGTIETLPTSLPPLTRSYYRYHLNFQWNRVHELKNMSYFQRSDYLDLSHNELRSVSSDAVEGFRALSTIQLSHNNLTTLPNSIHELASEEESKLAEIYLHNNPWSCDCHQLWLKKWLLLLGTRLQQPDGVLCMSPRRVQGRNLLSLADDEFLCGEPIDWQFVALVTLTTTISLLIFSVYFGLHHGFLTFLKVWAFAITGFHPFDRDECTEQVMFYDVFLCFVSQDVADANVLKDQLENRNYRVCLQAQSFHAGEDRYDKSATLVAKSRRVVCMLSPNFFESYINVWIIDHIFGDIQYRKRLIGIEISDVKPVMAQNHISQHLSKFIQNNSVHRSSRIYLENVMYRLPLKPLIIRPDLMQQLSQLEVNGDPDSNSTDTQPLLVMNRRPDFDDDESRIYDVFISFAIEQDPWVRKLVSDLEQDGKYKACVHNRDFINGIPIWDNIGIALEQSKRLLCVVSQSFNKSTFCKWEFQAALDMQMAGKHRVIVVLYDQLQEMILEPTLKNYLARYTYLEKWNPNFVTMLRKDLPLPRMDGEHSNGGVS